MRHRLLKRWFKGIRDTCAKEIFVRAFETQAAKEMV
jgi:hypothetical protein